MKLKQPVLSGAICCWNHCKPRIVNSTIVFNEAGQRFGSIWARDSCEIFIENTIFWGNQGRSPIQIGIEKSRLDIAFSLIDSTQIQIKFWAVGEINWGPGIFLVDPQFQDSAHSNFMLAANSPAIDAGNPAATFNDPEDPEHPGFALWPAQGGLRNDLGAFGGMSAFQRSTAINEKTELPEKGDLLQNYPNPFNPVTTIRFRVSKPGWLTLKIYNCLGRLVETLVEQNLNAGTYRRTWNGTNSDGVKVSSGVYLYRIQTGAFQKTMKMVLLE